MFDHDLINNFKTVWSIFINVCVNNVKSRHVRMCIVHTRQLNKP